MVEVPLGTVGATNWSAASYPNIEVNVAEAAICLLQPVIMPAALYPYPNVERLLPPGARFWICCRR
jgi:hypothetical protein